MNSIARSVLALTALLNIGHAFACGESMVHTGQAMRYHAFITRQPATILIYEPGAQPESNRQLLAGLQHAGHHVTLISDPSQFEQSVTQQHFDVVIAGAGEANLVTQRLQGSAATDLLVVVAANQTAGDYPNRIRADDSLNDYLKSIEHIMHTRGA